MRRFLVGLVALACLPTVAGHQAAAAAQPGPPDVTAPDVTARGAVLYDPVDEVVLHGVQEGVERPMASTTKIMTVLLALEAATVDDMVTVSENAAATGRIAGAATLGLRAGQTIPMRSILAGLVLRSGNDAAVAVAEHLAGGEDAFVGLMNARAAELGLADTHFVNASGLTDDPAHHASPLDLARLAAVAMTDADFAGWAGAATLDIPGIGPVVSRNELLGQYPGATGVKTGFTTLAGLCLVASATRDGRDLIAVLLGSDDSFGDATRLLDYGFGAFARPRPLAAGQTAIRYRWAGAEVELVAAGPLARTVPADAAVRWRTVLSPAAGYPAAAGATLGRAELLVEDSVAAAVDLVAASPVAPPTRRGAAAVGAAVQDALRAFARLESFERAA